MHVCALAIKRGLIHRVKRACVEVEIVSPKEPQNKIGIACGGLFPGLLVGGRFY